jgi:hypothetical protein
MTTGYHTRRATCAVLPIPALRRPNHRDDAELRRACEAIGIVYDPVGKLVESRDFCIEIVEERVKARVVERNYLQIVEPRRVALPEVFPMEALGGSAHSRSSAGSPHCSPRANWYAASQKTSTTCDGF